MECRKRLTPGMNGTKRHQQRFGDRLLYVRYRNDPERQRRLTTVEIIVDESPLPAPRNRAARALFPHPNHQVLVRIEYQESELRLKAKAAGAQWQPETKRWMMPFKVALGLGLRERIEEIGMDENGN